MYALITGATSGIGLEIAKMLASQKCNLILVGRRKKRLDYMKDYFTKKCKIKVVTFAYDLSEKDNCFKLFNECLPYNVEILINSAGFGKIGYVVDTNVNDDISMINTNITALHILTKLFSKHMRHGKILNIASIAGYFPGPYMSEYGATKAYVKSFSIAMNYELKKLKKDVHITTLCPGPVRTEFDKVAGSDFSINYISAKECARIALKGLMEEKDVVIPGFSTKLMAKLSMIAPKNVVLPIEHFLQTNKLNKNKNSF